MNWILIAITSGMLMTSSHDNEEACLGRKAMLEKDKITNAKCVDMRTSNAFISNGIVCGRSVPGSVC